jgi:ubiquinone/menaquinone biosynthesis C-methylase UbiE
VERSAISWQRASRKEVATRNREHWARFFELNWRVCERLAGRLPHTRVNAFGVYERTVVRSLQTSKGAIIVDVGTGEVCTYAAAKPPGTIVLGLDIVAESLRVNTDVDAAVVGDATHRLPLSDRSVDVVTTRSVLEHLADVDRFVAESSRVLRPEGVAIHLFSSRWSWFARLNRALGEKRARHLLYSLHPQSRESGGFPALYDRCTARDMSAVHRAHGFEVVDTRVFYGTNYAYFFVPAFMLVSLYELTLQAFNLRNHAATVVVTAQKPSFPAAG